MHTQMETFLNKLAVKFTRPEKVMEHKEKFGTLKGLDISLENQKADAAVTMGIVTKGRLTKFLDEGDFTFVMLTNFMMVSEGFITAFTYCTKWLPLGNPLMKNCVFIDFSLRNECSMDNVEEVLSSVEHIHREVINNPRAMDTLEEEFFVYQAMSEADIPAHIWKESKVVEKLDDNGTEVTYHRMDMIWGSLQ